MIWRGVFKYEIDEKIRDLARELEDMYSGLEITPKERDRITGKGNAADRVSVGMQCHDHSAALAGVPVKRICTDPAYYYYSQLVTLKRYGNDCILPSVPDIYNIDIEAVGTRIKYPDNSLPVIIEPVIKEPKDLDRVKVPDPEKDGRMSFAVEMHHIHGKHLGEYLNLNFDGCAPFSIAVGLRGFTNLAFDMANDPDFAHHLLQFSTDVAVEYGRFLYSNTGTPVSFTDAWASIPNISPAQWDEFALPYATQLLKTLPSGWTGMWGFSEPGADWKSMVRKVAASGSRSITLLDEDVDNTDLGIFKEIARSHNKLYNITVKSEYIFNDSEEKLASRIGEYLNEARPEGGFTIFGSMIPMDCPPEKVEAFIRICKRLGKYPVEAV